MKNRNEDKGLCLSLQVFFDKFVNYFLSKTASHTCFMLVNG